MNRLVKYIEDIITKLSSEDIKVANISVFARSEVTSLVGTHVIDIKIIPIGEDVISKLVKIEITLEYLDLLSDDKILKNNLICI